MSVGSENVCCNSKAMREMQAPEFEQSRHIPKHMHGQITVRFAGSETDTLCHCHCQWMTSQREMTPTQLLYTVMSPVHEESRTGPLYTDACSASCK